MWRSEKVARILSALLGRYPVSAVSLEEVGIEEVIRQLSRDMCRHSPEAAELDTDPRPGRDPVRAYRVYLLKSLRKHAAYRSAAWIHIGASMVSIWIQVSVWTALIGTGSAHGITRDQRVTYGILNSLMYAALFTGLYSEVDVRLRSGDIAIDLLRPVRYPLMLRADHLGRAAYRLVLLDAGCRSLPGSGLLGRAIRRGWPGDAWDRVRPAAAPHA